jgi:type IV pilus assembly protein PilB
MHLPIDQLKEFLLDTGLITEAMFLSCEKVAGESGVDIGTCLVQGSYISDTDLKKAEAYVLGVPFIDLSKQKIEYAILSIIPEPVARKHNIVSYGKRDGAVEVAMVNVDDLVAIEFIKKKTRLKILPRLTTEESIKKALLQYQKSLQADFGEIIKEQTGAITMLNEDSDNQSDADLKKVAEDLPVVKIVDTLLKHAIIQGASDIHIEPMEEQLLIRYRIDGILHDTMTLPKNAAAAIVARIKILSNLKIDEKRLPQDGRFKIELDGEKIGFRVSVLPVYYGEKVVMRILREGGGNFTLESLGFQGENLKRLEDSQKLKTGLVLTTGPTGSGKSTSLYTLLDIVNTPDVNISTIEDPIEYQMKRVNQTQVKSEIGFSFSEGLRTLVRQDPDIIMVGEIRDSETAQLAVNAALTGHLVLSTVHTNSASGTIPRLTDMGVEPFLLISTLKTIIGQRLIRRLIPEERESYKLSKAGIKSLGKIIDLDGVMELIKKEKIVSPKTTWNTIEFYRPKKKAPQGGYRGRLGIHEVLLMSPAIQELIIKGVSAEKLQAQAKKEGMLTMLEDGIMKAAKGLTTIEEVLRVISE